MKEFDLKRKTKKALVFWSIMSVAWVVSIPVMIVALVHGIWALAIPCIVIVGGNFYALPIGWVSYVFLVRQRNLYLAIVEEEITSIKGLAATLGKSQKGTLREVRGLIAKRYLRGYILNEACTDLILVEKKPKPKPQSSQTHCISCGAVIPINSDHCLYCHCRLK